MKNQDFLTYARAHAWMYPVLNELRLAYDQAHSIYDQTHTVYDQTHAAARPRALPQDIEKKVLRWVYAISATSPYMEWFYGLAPLHKALMRR